MNHQHPLTEQALRQFAPSVFAGNASRRVSGKYQFVSTLHLVEALECEGWQPVYARESRARLDERHGFTKHLLRFRRFDDRLPMINESYPEIVLLNSHDGSCAYQMHAGLFRVVCENGLIVADKNMGQIRRRHTGEAVGEIIEGAYEIVEELPAIAGQVQKFSELELKPAEQRLFAEAALTLRWEDGKAPINTAQLLEPHRQQDKADDLWTTYQRIQENLIKGGQRGKASTGRRTRTRPVQSVDNTLKVNKALWLLTERMAELKSA